LVKNPCRVRFPVVFFVSAIVLFIAAFLAVEGWRRWLLMAIFGLPGASALWLGIESLRRTPTDIAEDREMDGTN
jgi:hypothetical protein